MCLAYPVQVVAVEPGRTAIVSWHGRRERVSLLATDDQVDAGDWLLVHSGVALARLDADDAAQRRQLIDQVQRDAPPLDQLQPEQAQPEQAQPHQPQPGRFLGGQS
jgi:hydrogenase expression/formation protein HypC